MPRKQKRRKRKLGLHWGLPGGRRRENAHDLGSDALKQRKTKRPLVIEPERNQDAPAGHQERTSTRELLDKRSDRRITLEAPNPSEGMRKEGSTHTAR